MQQPNRDSNRRFPLPRLATAVVVMMIGFVLTACPLEFEDLQTPTILDVTVSPSQIDEHDIGPHNDFDFVEISTANFDDELDPDSARAFIEGNEFGAAADSDTAGDVQVDGNVIILYDVPTTWFNEYSEPGTYNIGAAVEALNTNTSARARNVGAVTVTSADADSH